MAVRSISSAEFYQLSRRSEGKLLVVKFTATWCGPCRRVAPQYEALAQRNPDVDFVKVYEHDSRDAIINSGVNSFPTFHFYCNGGKVDECRGANIQNVEQRVQQHKGSASAAGPVSVKLLFDQEKLRRDRNGIIHVSQEAEVEVHASEGLEIFKYQILSMTDIGTDEQILTTGESSTPIADDDGLKAALKTKGGGLYGNYPVVRVTKRAKDIGSVRTEGVSTEAVVSMKGNTDTPRWDACCSETFFGTRPLIQPAYVIREEALLSKSGGSGLHEKKAGSEDILVVCRFCAENCFGAGIAELSPAISELVSFVCQSEKAFDKGYGADLLSRQVGAGEQVNELDSAKSAAAKSAAAAAEQAYFSSIGASLKDGENQEMLAMRQKMSGAMRTVLAYEDPRLQAKARSVLPTAEGEGGDMNQRARELAAAGGFSQEETLALALLRWFKKDFFEWTNKPPCSSCGARGAALRMMSMARPSAEEMAFKASRVEVYQCTECPMLTRFPRYNDPGKLLETRRGRCGEWANCFTLICRAVGLEARHVIDWTDHVWTEIWIPARNRWVHADPCEDKLDKPLMYEAGWNKKLSYVLAFDRDGVVDVTRRYTRRWVEVLSRRTLVPEKWLAGVLAMGNAASSVPAARTALLSVRLEEEKRELEEYGLTAHGEDHIDREEEEGRRSGDAEWIASRGEDGVLTTGETPSSSPQITSSLVGAPLGQLQPRGGLGLCVTAVVEGFGGVLILVGGAKACHSPGNAHGALCAGAVSSTTGVLLDARAFSLRTEEGSSALTAELPEWLDNLPNGVVVCVACGSGRATSAAALADGLKGALENLLHGDQDDAADSRAVRKLTGTTGWTLVGWKGAGVPEWGRCQDHNAGYGKRSALYAELIFPPPAPSAVEQYPGASSKSMKIELEGKLCLSPLCSLPDEAQMPAPAAMPDVISSPVDSVQKSTPTAEGTKLPARGLCYRPGESTVTVGPTIDLVDCPGWTTVLSAPSDTDNLEGRKALPSAVWRVTTVSPAMGVWRPHTTPFDGMADGCPSAVMGGFPLSPADGAPGLLSIARVRDIVVWSGHGINGVRVAYDVGGDVVWGVKNVGSFGPYEQSTLTLDLDGGETVTEVSIKTGKRIVESLKIKTNKGREKKWGSDIGLAQELTWSIPSGKTFLGFHGGRSHHLQSLGVILVEQGGATEVEENNAKPCPEGSSLSPMIKAGLYNTDPVFRAFAQLVCFNPMSSSDDCVAREDILNALRTAVKYARNLLASPLDEKFSSIRLANRFFDRKIGRIPGGGGVIRAMGFELTDVNGRMHYVFRRQGGKGSLSHLQRAHRTLEKFLSHMERSSSY